MPRYKSQANLTSTRRRSPTGGRTRYVAASRRGTAPRRVTSRNAPDRLQFEDVGREYKAVREDAEEITQRKDVPQRYRRAAQRAAEGKSDDDGGLLGFLRDVPGVQQGLDVLGSEPVQWVLNKVDAPRALVVSGVKEFADAMSSGSETGDASWEDFWQQYQDRIGFGDVWHDVAVAEGNEWAQNRFVELGAGLVGDVGLDPLTYGTLGVGTVAKGTLKAGAEASARAAARKTARAGGRAATRRGLALSVADRASQYGLDSPSIDNLIADIGIRGVDAGTNARLARSGVSRETATRLGLPEFQARVGVRGHTIPILPGSKAIGQGLGNVRGAVRSRLVRTGLAHRIRQARNFEGDIADEIAATQTLLGGVGTAKQRATAARVLASADKSRGVSGAFSDRVRRELHNAIKPYRRTVREDGPRIVDELESLDPTAMGKEASAIREVLDNAYNSMKNEYDVDLPYRENYVPHRLSVEAKEAVEGGAEELAPYITKVAGKRRSTFEMQRRLTAGESFLGETLQHGTIREINDISERVLGYKFLDDDIASLLTKYIDEAHRSVQSRALINRLVELGEAKPLSEKVIQREVVSEASRRLAGKTAKTAQKEGRRVKALYARATDTRGVGGKRIRTLLANKRNTLVGTRAALAKEAEAAEKAVTAAGDAVTRAESRLATARAAEAEAKRIAGSQRRATRKTAQRRLKKVEDEIEVRRAELAAAKAELEAATESTEQMARFAQLAERLLREGDEVFNDELVQREAIQMAQDASVDIEEEIAQLSSRLAWAAEQGAKGISAEDVFQLQRQLNAANMAREIRGLMGMAARGREMSREEIARLASEISDLKKSKKYQQDVLRRASGPVLPRALKLAQDATATARQNLEDLQEIYSRELDTAAHTRASVDATVAEIDEHLKVIEQVFKQTKVPRKANPRQWRDARLYSQRSRERFDIIKQYLKDNPDDEIAKQVAKIEADAAALDLKAALGGIKAAKIEDYTATLLQPEVQQTIKYQVDKGLRAITEAGPQGLQANPQVAQLLQVSQKMNDPKWWDGLVNHYDKFNNWFKAWAVASPGFLMRNMYAGVFNNYVAGIPNSAYWKFRKLYKLYYDNPKNYTEVITRKFGAEEARRFEGSIEAIAASGWGQSAQEVMMSLFPPKRSINPLRADNVVTRPIRRVNEGLETWMRGAHAYGVMQNGGTVQDAIEGVTRWHFNYRDLSSFDRAMKRPIPFWVFLSRNIPLQVDVLTHSPQLINRTYGNLKRNLERMSEEEELKPGYYDELGGIRLPWDIPGLGEGTEYLFPDLPVLRLQEDVAKMTNPMRALADANPAIRLPLEFQAEKQFYSDIPITNDLEPAPSYAQVPGIRELLKATGMLKEDATGNLMMSQKNAYLVDSLAVPLSRARRLMPADRDERFDSRHGASLLSFLGLGVRSNTPQAQRGEVLRRRRALSKIKDELEQLGYTE